LSPGPAVGIFDAVQGQKQQATTIVKNNGASISDKVYPVIMNGVFNSDLPMPEKTVKGLFHEVALVIDAGSDHR